MRLARILHLVVELRDPAAEVSRGRCLSCHRMTRLALPKFFDSLLLPVDLLAIGSVSRTSSRHQGPSIRLSSSKGVGGCVDTYLTPQARYLDLSPSSSRQGTMVSSIVASLKPLFWATLLFSMLIYAVAVAMTQMANASAFGACWDREGSETVLSLRVLFNYTDWRIGDRSEPHKPPLFARCRC